jgi:hypothetical protein
MGSYPRLDPRSRQRSIYQHQRALAKAQRELNRERTKLEQGENIRVARRYVPFPYMTELAPRLPWQAFSMAQNFNAFSQVFYGVENISPSNTRHIVIVIGGTQYRPCRVAQTSATVKTLHINDGLIGAFS